MKFAISKYILFHIREDTRHFLYTDKMEFHVLELPKLPKELREDSSNIELWKILINAEHLAAKKGVY